MEHDFDAVKFVEQVRAGEFDRRLLDEIRKLSYEELRQVAVLMLSEEKKRKGASGE